MRGRKRRQRADETTEKRIEGVALWRQYHPKNSHRETNFHDFRGYLTSSVCVICGTNQLAFFSQPEAVTRHIFNTCLSAPGKVNFATLSWLRNKTEYTKGGENQRTLAGGGKDNEIFGGSDDEEDSGMLLLTVAFGLTLET